MKLDPNSGWLTGVRRAPSPNQDNRPPDVSVDLLVLHGISLPPGEFGGNYVEQLFTNTLPVGAHPFFRELEGFKVSAHLFLRRNGTLVQFVPLHRRAWHAGVSAHAGRERCNDFSIGIELEGSDHIPYTSRQYRRLASITRLLMRHFPAMTPQRIVGHSDIAPGRKTDPGPAFDWRHFRCLLMSVGSNVPAAR